MGSHFGCRGLGAFTLTIALGAAGLAACGDDDKSSARTKEGYCAFESQIDAAFNSAFEGLGADATEEQMIAAAAAVSKTVLDKFGAGAKAAAPDEIAADVAVLFAAVEKAAAGDPEAFNDPAMGAAGDRVDEFCYGPPTQDTTPASSP